MTDPAVLERRARSLGVATSYEDAGGTHRRVPEATVVAVCDLLEASSPAASRAGGPPGGGRSGHDPFPGPPFGDVVVVRGGRITSGVRQPSGASGERGGVHGELVLEDGTRLPAATLSSGRVASPGTNRGVELAAGVPPSQLPHGMHMLTWTEGTGPARTTTVIVAPEHFPSLSDRSSGAGFGALLDVVDAAAGHALDCIATLPLFAPGLGERFEASPYSPVSRFHLNEVYAAARLRADPERRGEPSAVAGAHVDWPAVGSDALRRLARFVDVLEPSQREALGTFLAARPDVVSYAAFCGTDDVPQQVYEVGQWLAERGLETVVDELHRRGVRLALDLPVGSRPGGWEHANWPELFVGGATIGAPADSFFEEGQDWGLPPVDPAASRRGGHRMWHDLLANAARHADILRIDHVMQVLRLWWIPSGATARQGTYVSYPADELLAVAALVAERTGTAMVGEDLGTVPPEVVERMSDWRLPGMYEEVFALHDMADTTTGPASRSGAARLPQVPPRCWAGLRTHDMAPVASVAYEVDTAPYRRAVASELDRVVDPGTEPLTEAMVERLGRSGAGEVVVDIHDALGATTAHNVPGTVGPRNWSLRLPVSTEQLSSQPGFQGVLAALDRSVTNRESPTARASGRQTTGGR